MSSPRLDRPWLSRPVLDLAHPTPHVESFFTKANDPAARRALWVRLTLFSDGRESYGETWAVLFDGERHRTLAAKERWTGPYLRVDRAREGLRIGPCELGVDGCRGRVAGQGFTIGFAIALDDELPPYTPLPRWMYESARVGSKSATPHPCARAAGSLDLWTGDPASPRHERIALDGWRAMQGHNWGRRHADDYAWVHCNSFDGEQSFFEGLTARGRLAGLATRVTLARLVTGHRSYRFDTFASSLRARGHHGPTSWTFRLRGPDGTLAGAAHGRPEETVGLTYANPGAPPLYCYNTKLAELTLELSPKRGDPVRLYSDRAALEVGQLSRAAGVEVVL